MGGPEVGVQTPGRACEIAPGAVHQAGKESAVGRTTAMSTSWIMSTTAISAS
jgi:hypothetical protein